MLSKFDIENEIGKGICIFPLNLSNIKESSVNLCASNIAWATTSMNVYYCEKEYDKNKRFSLKPDSKYDQILKIESKQSALARADNGREYIIVLPFSTTLIETKEVLALSNYLGGTYHSKVGLVSQGIGHIGTMVGPNFSGDSLIAIHNTSNGLIVLDVGESFVSVVFHYLNTPYTHLNPTTSGHTDKFSALGLQISQEQLEELNQDWKKSIDEVRKKMICTSQYKELQQDLREKKKRKTKMFFNKKNIMTLVITIAIFVILYLVAKKIDSSVGNSVWVDRYFNVGCSGLFVAIFSMIIKRLIK